MDKVITSPYWTLNHVLGWIILSLLFVGMNWALFSRARPTDKTAPDYEENLSRYWQRASWTFLLPAYLGVAISSYFLLSDTDFLLYEDWNLHITAPMLAALTWIILIKPIKMFIKVHSPIEIGLYVFWGTPLCYIRNGLWVQIPKAVTLFLVTTTQRQKEYPTDYSGNKPPISISTGEVADFQMDFENKKATITTSKRTNATETEQGVLRTVINLVMSIRMTIQLDPSLLRETFRKYGEYYIKAEKHAVGSGEEAMIDEIFSQLFDEASSAAEAYGPKHTAHDVMTNQKRLNKDMQTHVVEVSKLYVKVLNVSVVKIDYDPEIKKALDDFTQKILETNEKFYEQEMQIKIYSQTTEAMKNRKTDLGIEGIDILNAETSLQISKNVGNLVVIAGGGDSSLGSLLQASIANNLGSKKGGPNGD